MDQLTHEMAILKRWKFDRSRPSADAARSSGARARLANGVGNENRRPSIH
jgi:hypothetical protein